jgi:hypothetical protein
MSSVDSLEEKLQELYRRIETSQFGDLDPFETAELVMKVQRIDRKITRIIDEVERLLEASE